MRSMNRIALAAALSLLGATAFAQDVKTDYDKAADFSALKSFSVKMGTTWGNPLGEQRVVAEFEQALAEKGWTKTTPDKADALVVLHGATQTKKSLNTFYSGDMGWGGYGYRGWGGGMGMGSATTTESEYTVGTLVVDIFNAHSKQLVFRGTAQDELSDKPEKNQKKLAKASDKMFKDFPPGSGKKK
jgi:uncharacterized protein DUF4136